MRLPSTPRRTGARNKPVHFSYVSTERGQPYEAYLAGQVWWGYLHMLRPSKPCVFELTGGAVACRFCAGSKARVAVVKGWVPLYRRQDGLAICVPVDEVQRDHLDALPIFTKVTVGREKGKGVGVWVRSCMNQEPAWSSSLPEYSCPADISASLINMWALEEVHQFFACERSSDNAVSLASKPPAEVMHSLEGDDVPRPKRAGKGDGAMLGGTDAAVNRLIEHAAKFAAKPSTNGKHKPDGGSE
jgi:hypothetical protein